MERLSEYQLRVLTRLANGKSKVYAAFSGIPGTDEEEAANDCFNDICKLVEWKLVTDISDEIRWAPIHADHERQGQQVIIVNITFRGGWMFEKVKWDKWKN